MSGREVEGERKGVLGDKELKLEGISNEDSLGTTDMGQKAELFIDFKLMRI